MEQLTKIQKKVRNWIRSFIKRKGYAPTVRQISGHFNWSQNGAQGHLDRLRAKGAVEWDDGKARTLRVL